MSRNNRINRRKKAVKNISIESLRRFVMKEAAKLSGELESVEKVKAEEVEASEYADTLEQDLDVYKAMKIKEARLRRQYKKVVKEARKIRKNKQIAKKRILRNLK